MLNDGKNVPVNLPDRLGQKSPEKTCSIHHWNDLWKQITAQESPMHWIPAFAGMTSFT